ncbi:MAG: hypothetical protein SFV20_07890 [Sphingopyxis sp.]|nr:hypothetical protein [Sphingopyxis sp.]
MSSRNAQSPNLLTFILSLLPALYFGGFLWYFNGVGGGNIAGIVDIGLGPTVAGLGLLVALFSIKPIIVVLRFLLGADWVTTRNERQGAGPASSMAGDEAFDADAALARYMAGRSASREADGPPPIDPAPSPPPRPGFGRKGS